MTHSSDTSATRVHPPSTRGLRWLALAATTATLALAQPAWAGSRDDQERARQAVQSGQVLALGDVLMRLERERPGQVMKVELEQDHGVWIYEIKLLQPDGRLVKLKLDARTAQVLRGDSRNDSAGRQREKAH